jgi:hypothetical protein
MTDPAPRPAKVAPRIGLSALEWRLYLMTALAAIYTAVWLTLAADVEPPVTAAAQPAPTTAPTTAPIATGRPAARPTAPRATGPRPTRAAPRVATTRRVRVRTRSS